MQAIHGDSMYVKTGPNGIEIVTLDTTLAKGSLKNCRVKFADSLRAAAIERVVQELEDGSLYLGDWTKGEIEITGIKEIVATKYWLLVVYNVLNAPLNGGTEPVPSTYQNLVWNIGRAPGGMVLPITREGKLVLVRSFRHAKRTWTIELPGGARLPNESLKDCAIREMEQECGAVLSDASKMVSIGILDVDNGVIAQESKYFIATNVEVDPAKVNRDLTESHLKTLVVTIDQFNDWMMAGKITCARTIAAVKHAEMRGLLRARMTKFVGMTDQVLRKCTADNEYTVELRSDGRIFMVTGYDDMVAVCYNIYAEVSVEELERLLRYLQRASRRKDGAWFKSLPVINGHRIDIVADRRTPVSSFFVQRTNHEQARELANLIQEVLKTRKQLKTR